MHKTSGCVVMSQGQRWCITWIRRPRRGDLRWLRTCRQRWTSAPSW